MLHSFSLNLHLTLSEALYAANGVVYKIIDQILIEDLFLIDDLGSESNYDLRVIYKAGLHHFRELRYHVFLFEEGIMISFLSIDQNTSHGFKQVIEDLFEICNLIQRRTRSEDVLFKNLKEELHITSRESYNRPGVLHSK